MYVLIPSWIVNVGVPVCAGAIFLRTRIVSSQWQIPAVFMSLSVIGYMTFFLSATEILLVLLGDGVVRFAWVFAFIPLYFLFVMLGQPLTALLLVRGKQLCF